MGDRKMIPTKQKIKEEIIELVCQTFGGIIKKEERKKFLAFAKLVAEKAIKESLSQPKQKYHRGDRLICLETEEYCVIHISGTDRQWVKFPDSHIGVYTNEQIAELFELLPKEPKQEPVAIRYDFDGYGYQYIDSGTGSDWQTRVQGEPLYTAPPQIEVGCAECGVGGGHALYCVACAEKFVGEATTKLQQKQETIEGLNRDYDLLFAEYQLLRKKEWVGLTDEEIEQGCKESWVTKQAFQSAVWWAEDKLKDKNNNAKT